MRYTVIDMTIDGLFELLCYYGNNCVLEKVYSTEDEAVKMSQLFLCGKLNVKYE